MEDIVDDIFTLVNDILALFNDTAKALIVVVLRRGVKERIGNGLALLDELAEEVLALEVALSIAPRGVERAPHVLNSGQLVRVGGSNNAHGNITARSWDGGKVKVKGQSADLNRGVPLDLPCDGRGDVLVIGNRSADDVSKWPRRALEGV